MTLDSTINELWNTSNKKNQRTTRQATLESLTKTLTEHQEELLTYEQLRLLDNTAHRLKTLPHNNLYQTTIERIDAIRSEYRRIGPSTANNILTTSGTNYTTRIAEVHAYLDTQEATYDDLRQLEHTLTKNAYLKRRAKNNSQYQQEQETLLAKVRNAIQEQDQHQQRLHNNIQNPQKQRGLLETYYTPIKKRVVQGLLTISAAAIAVAATPASIIIPLYNAF